MRQGETLEASSQETPTRGESWDREGRVHVGDMAGRPVGRLVWDSDKEAHAEIQHRRCRGQQLGGEVSSTGKHCLKSRGWGFSSLPPGGRGHRATPEAGTEEQGPAGRKQLPGRC